MWPTRRCGLGEVEVHGMWVLSPGETRSAQKVDARKVGVSQGESTIARKTVVPRTNIKYCILDNNCIITQIKC